MSHRAPTPLVAALAVAAVLLASAAPAAAAGHRAGRVPHEGAALLRANPHLRLPLHGGAVTSLNWAGYAVTPAAGGVTAVTSTFTVPSAGLIPPGFAATWAGIGGYSTSDLIQAGVAEQSLPSTTVLGAQYYAWYEVLPTDSVPLSGCSTEPGCTVGPGDVITVDIVHQSGTQWQVTVSDAHHWTFTKTLTYHSSFSSAEWILEAPSVDGLPTLLAPTGTTAFGPTSTFTAGGTSERLAQGDPTQIDLSPLPVAGLFDEATPSGVAGDGQSFDVCAYALSCPTP